MGRENVSVRARQIDTGRDKESLAQRDPLEGGDWREPIVSTFPGDRDQLHTNRKCKALEFLAFKRKKPRWLTSALGVNPWANFVRTNGLQVVSGSPLASHVFTRRRVRMFTYRLIERFAPLVREALRPSCPQTSHNCTASRRQVSAAQKAFVTRECIQSRSSLGRRNPVVNKV